jgi:hypothetical protein
MDRKRREYDAASAYGAGFVASALVVSAIVLCGVLVIVTRFAASSTVSEPAMPGARQQVSAAPADRPVTPDHPISGATGSPGCGQPAGDQSVPVAAPRDAEWVVYRRVVVPQSAQIGPGRTDADGFRHCFAHSPTGAVFAAYHAIAAFEDGAKAVATARKLLLPGPDRDRMLREVELEADQPADGESAQLAGFRIIDASRDRLSVALAMRVGDGYGSATLTLAWYDGDWRVVAPRPGEQFGAPFAQLDDLAGFVPWGGI